ncbi:MAG: MFS transporter [Alphaproteobacteria bacterium]
MSVKIKFYQAIGGMPDSFKNWSFNTFLLLFYNQILGLPASSVSVVLTLAIVIDAVTDPMVGSFSDSLQSKWGRRHPLMYAAILPLGLCLYCVFAPPEGLEDMALLVWLAVFAIGSRIAMTFYVIPWTALFAELSDDYEERSSIVTWRYLVGGIGTIFFTIAVWTFFFPTTDAYPQGQLNPNGYGGLALTLSLTVMAAAFLTTILTHRQIPYLLQPIEVQKFGLRATFGDLADALKKRDFVVLFAGLMVAALLSGTLEAMGIYLNTYFWELTAEDLRWFSIAALGGIAAFALIPPLQKRFDKKHILIGAMVLSLIEGVGGISLRFIDVLPDNGEPMLLVFLLVRMSISITLVVIIGIMFVSMVADTLDAQELETGKRQEGVFSAAIAFSGKAVSGFGILAAGLLLDAVVMFPAAAAPGEVDETMIVKLGAVMIAVSMLYVVPFYMATRYRISRTRHAEIVAALAMKRAANLPPPMTISQN